jgi:6,7-dimethyl-8-ribityllumazine synthase
MSCENRIKVPSFRRKSNSHRQNNDDTRPVANGVASTRNESSEWKRERGEEEHQEDGWHMRCISRYAVIA